MQKVVILEHDGGEMANQLWNHLSVAAYAAERGVACENWSFYEYPGFFAFRQPHWLVHVLFEPRFVGYRKRKAALKTRLWRKLYKVCVVLPVRLRGSYKILSSVESRTNIYNLPPTEPPSEHLTVLERETGTVYLANQSGSVFRNREGILRHRARLVELFKPTAALEKKVENILSAPRATYKQIIGLHLRQGDYATFKEGKYAIPQTCARKIIDEFLAEKLWRAEDTYIYIASDGKIDESLFAGLNYMISSHDVGTDLFVLTRCDVLVGSDSTLGHFASYIGNIPHVVMKREPMDWGYYRGRVGYFPNKYLTVMAY